MAVAHPPQLQCRFPEEKEPKLRHEFVGMMFALAIGEIGLQVAELVRYPGSQHYFLAAYTHLFLATIVIATSWVGWTRSLSPGARYDVQTPIEAGFVVLLLDVALVVCYFVLARAVDFHKTETEGKVQFSASAALESFWIFVIFCLYLVWDIWTKFVVSLFRRIRGLEYEKISFGLLMRFVPTIVSIGLASLAWYRFVDGASQSEVVFSDIALLSLVLFFRASKDLVSAFWPSKGSKPCWDKSVAGFFTVFFCIVFLLLSFCRIEGKPKDLLDNFINSVKPPSDVKIEPLSVGRAETKPSP